MRKPMIAAVSGVKNSGKTTLLTKLIPALSERGLCTAVVKHDGHSFDADREGRDTCRLFEAGAFGTAIFDGEKFQVVKRSVTTAEELIAFFPEADLILLEGFKESPLPKVEIVRKGNSEQSVCDPKTLLALITDTELQIPGVPSFGLEAIEELADLFAEEVKKKSREETAGAER